MQYEAEELDFDDKRSVKLHGAEGFAGMRKAGALAASILDDMVDVVKPGLSTLEINDICHAKIIAAGAIPAPLGYRGFPPNRSARR